MKKPYRYTKKDLKLASAAYKKLNKIPHGKTATELYFDEMNRTTRESVIDLGRMMFLGWPVQSWMNLYSAIRANYNTDNPDEAAKIINFRGLR